MNHNHSRFPRILFCSVNIMYDNFYSSIFKLFYKNCHMVLVYSKINVITLYIKSLAFLEPKIKNLLQSIAEQKVSFSTAWIWTLFTCFTKL